MSLIGKKQRLIYYIVTVIINGDFWVFFTIFDIIFQKVEETNIAGSFGHQ